jgi:hypothetical protein
MKHGLLLFWLLSLTGFTREAQPLQFRFEMYEGDAVILDALEKRLLQGGAPAVEAVGKIPDFVRSGRVEMVEELEFEAASGQRKKEASSTRMLKLDDLGGEVCDGLSVDSDPVFDERGGSIDMNLHVEWGRKEGRDVKTTRITTSVILPSGEPVLLARWAEGEVDRMLMVTGTAPGVAKAEGSPEAGTGRGRLVYVDTIVYKSAVDAEAGRGPVARMLFPSRSGQRAKMEDHVMVLFDVDGRGTMDAASVGMMVEMDPLVDEGGGSVELDAAVDYSEEPGGTERTVDGVRIPRVEIHRARAQLTLKDGEAGTVEMEKLTLVDSKGQPEEWRVRQGIRLTGPGG